MNDAIPYLIPLELVNKYNALGWALCAAQQGSRVCFFYKSPRMKDWSQRYEVVPVEDRLLTWEASEYVEQVFGPQVDMALRRLENEVKSDMVAQALKGLTPGPNHPKLSLSS